MNMNFSVSAWKRSYQAFEAQVELFNKQMNISSFPSEEMDKIYQIVKTEVKNLKAFAEAIAQKEKELDQPGCCSPTSRFLWEMGLINGTTKVCEVTGALLATFASEPVSKYAGLGLFIGGELINLAASIHESYIYLKTSSVADLAKINKEGVEHAKIFKKFLKELREINKMEKQILEENISSSKKMKEKLIEENKFPQAINYQINVNLASKPAKLPLNLDEHISYCLHQYEELPSCYKRNDIYSRIISILIQQLPKDDPLRQGLEDLEPKVDFPLMENVSRLAEKPLPIHYLPTNKTKFLQASDEKWQVEKQSREGTDIELEEQMTSPHSKEEYDRKLAHYKFLVARRFQIKTNFAFIDTPNGWRLNSSEHITRIPEPTASDASSSLASLPLKEQKKIIKNEFLKKGDSLV